jgi:serine/threonine protein phosphatase 1
MPPRVLAIGDIHGCHRALTTLLNCVSPTAEDLVVFVGDAVDRGPASRQVIDCILALREQCQVVFILGNHEEMMLDSLAGRGLLDAWLAAGGRQTLDSYGGSLEDIPPEHVRFLRSAVSYFETETEIFVHANLEQGVPLADQRIDYLRWKRIVGDEPRYAENRRVICGHSSQRDGMPLVFDGWAVIDTYAYGGQWLSCLDVQSNQIVQANESGELRESPLSKDA